MGVRRTDDLGVEAPDSKPRDPRGIRGAMALLTALLFAPQAAAGPWVKAPGEAYVKAGGVRFAASGFVGPDGVPVEGAAYVGTTGHVYGEVGAVGPVQVVFNLPVVGSRNTFGDVAYVNRQFGDAEVGLEAGRQVGGKVPVSLQILGKLPLYDNGELAQYGLSATRFPAIGDGQVDVTALAAVGTGIAAGGFRGWWTVEAGYRHRTELWMGDRTAPDRVLVDGVPWHLQLGWSPTFGAWEAGWWSVDASGIDNLQTDAVTKQWIQLSTGLGVRVWEGLAVEAGASRMVWARNSAQGRSVTGGLSWTL